MAVLRISYFVMFFSALLWTKGESCSNGVYPESGFALVDHVFKSLHVDHLVSCYISCTAQPSCQSLNYNPGDKTCQLNNDTKYFRPKYFVVKPTFVYAENPSSEHPWRKLNSAAVCFGAKDDQFGQFQVEFGGSIEAVKLVHLSGQVSCDQHANVWSKWGCNGKHIFVFLTDASRTILLPMDQNSPYTIPGYDAQSSEIVFSGLPNPLHLRSGQELRMWYEEDLKNVFESDNGGKTCADVFVKYL
ncbi:PREDICTED: uncharacterized protein LOC107328208 isoform X1 [Acropora digitifera]|uniref:uncharacterized protein LOC107328208 isoform X1 n=1 Tax=Acropora digitifera TaxID=70779 RepID=UPI00077A0030|nr:PREDICTED: uncharacterized protein LOC107328208 isoform X1 [Acropora digitifera]